MLNGRIWTKTTIELKKAGYTTREIILLRRNQVRRWVTHAASLFLFLGGGLMIIYLVSFLSPGSDTKDHYGVDHALQIFATLAPIAASVITFWFAGGGRRKENWPDEENQQGKENEGEEHEDRM